MSLVTCRKSGCGWAFPPEEIIHPGNTIAGSMLGDEAQRLPYCCSCFARTQGDPMDRFVANVKQVLDRFPDLRRTIELYSEHGNGLQLRRDIYEVLKGCDWVGCMRLNNKLQENFMGIEVEVERTKIEQHGEEKLKERLAEMINMYLKVKGRMSQFCDDKEYSWNRNDIGLTAKPDDFLLKPADVLMIKELKASKKRRVDDEWDEWDDEFKCPKNEAEITESTCKPTSDTETTTVNNDDHHE